MRPRHTLATNVGPSRHPARVPSDQPPSPTRGRPRPCPQCDGRALEGDAYAHLLGLYLGDGFITRMRRDVYKLAIYCDLAYEGLMDEAMDSMYRVNPGMSVNAVPGSGCAGVMGYWKHWPCLFPQHGSGRKHTRAIVLDEWQRSIVEAQPAFFVRGLLHSDGCRSINRVTRRLPSGTRTYAYPRWFFSNRSEDILQLCEWGLDLLGVEHQRNLGWSISVAKRDSVAILDELVGAKY
jgi:hypothetical protein